MDNHLNLQHIKIIGVFVIISSIIGILTFLWLILLQGQFANIGIWPILLVCLLGIYAGINILKNNYIGKKLLVLFFTLQIFQFSSPSLTIVLYAGLTFNITTGNGTLGVNLVAFILLLLSIRMLREHKHIGRSRLTAQ